MSHIVKIVNIAYSSFSSKELYQADPKTTMIWEGEIIVKICYKT